MRATYLTTWYFVIETFKTSFFAFGLLLLILVFGSSSFATTLSEEVVFSARSKLFYSICNLLESTC